MRPHVPFACTASAHQCNKCGVAARACNARARRSPRVRKRWISEVRIRLAHLSDDVTQPLALFPPDRVYSNAAAFHSLKTNLLCLCCINIIAPYLESNAACKAGKESLSEVLWVTFLIRAGDGLSGARSETRLQVRFGDITGGATKRETARLPATGARGPSYLCSSIKMRHGA
jgi:hypothetical protein